jgi:3-vinyl bacteriochlorophyllide hydratase
MVRFPAAAVSSRGSGRACFFTITEEKERMPRYTPEQLAKRNASVWTDIQIVLAPVQFIFFVAGVTVTTLYANGIIVNGFYWVSIAILFKTLFFGLLFTTGMFFEKDIFNQWVYSKEFLWEDIGSTVAAFFHLFYFYLAFFDYPREVLIWDAFIAYFTYVVNAMQYLVRIILEKRNERMLRMDGRM